MRILSIVFVAMILFACKKTPVTPDPEPPEPTGTTLQLLADSVFLLSKEMYYWKDTIGAVSYTAFNPRQYVGTDELTTAKSVLDAVRNYSYWDRTKHYSFAESYIEGSSSSRAGTTETSYGFDVKDGWGNRSATRPANFSGWYISYVYPNSDAGRKGVMRGMKLAKVNGTTLAYTQSSVDILNNMFYYETLKSVEAQFVKANGDTLKVSVSNSSFATSSVLHSTVLNTPKGSKVGYMVYKFFDRLADSQADLDAALQSFKDQSVNSVILDMRYNNGGYTATQNYLTNRLAPSSATGLMYKYYYNSNLNIGAYTALKSRYPNYLSFTTDYTAVNFNTSNSIHPAKLYIIVSPTTASSSELLINNLKPVFGNNIVLIGDDNTYGKPVGFFPVDLFKKVTFWTVSFITKNRNADSVSYSGFVPDYRVYDGVDKAWGDVTEDCTATAITLIDGGSVAAAAQAQTVPRSVQSSTVLNLKKKERLTDNMLFTRD